MLRIVLLSGNLVTFFLLCDLSLIACPQDDRITALGSLYGVPTEHFCLSLPSQESPSSSRLCRLLGILRRNGAPQKEIISIPVLCLVLLFFLVVISRLSPPFTKLGKHADVGSSLPRPGTELSSPGKEKDKINGSLSTILLLGLLVLILFSLSVLLQLDTFSPVAQQ
jgi:hypothetical protein